MTRLNNLFDKNDILWFSFWIQGAALAATQTPMKVRVPPCFFVNLERSKI